MHQQHIPFFSIIFPDDLLISTVILKAHLCTEKKKVKQKLYTGA